MHLSLHPLIDLVNDRDVKQAKGFRAAAEKLTGASLETDYQREMESAPKRSDKGLEHLNVRVGRRAKQRQNNRDEKHLAEAIARAAHSAPRVQRRVRAPLPAARRHPRAALRR